MRERERERESERESSCAYCKSHRLHPVLYSTYCIARPIWRIPVRRKHTAYPVSQYMAYPSIWRIPVYGYPSIWVSQYMAYPSIWRIPVHGVSQYMAYPSQAETDLCAPPSWRRRRPELLSGRGWRRRAEGGWRGEAASASMLRGRESERDREGGEKGRRTTDSILGPILSVRVNIGGFELFGRIRAAYTY